VQRFTNICRQTIACNAPPWGWKQEWPKHVGDVLCLQHKVALYIFVCICWFLYNTKGYLPIHLQVLTTKQFTYTDFKEE